MASSDPGLDDTRNSQTKPKKVPVFKSGDTFSMDEPLSPSSQGTSFHTSS